MPFGMARWGAGEDCISEKGIGDAVRGTAAIAEIVDASAACEAGPEVSQQDEKSQHKNKAKAMKVLRARLYDLERSKLDAERAQNRRSQVGTGDRSERIRTYNFPQGRVTDHRIGFTTHQLPYVLEGAPALDEIIDALTSDYQTNQLAALQEEANV